MADMKITDFTARSELATSDLLLVSDSSANYHKMQLSTLIAGLSDHCAKLGLGFFVCLTEAATAAKTIDAAQAPGYKPVRGAPFVVYFSNDVPANATLNINSTGAGDLWFRSSAVTADLIKGGDLVLLAYVETALEEKRYMVLAIDRSCTAYQKPSGGIPKADLASAVQTSLGKADSAYQKPSGGIPKADLASAVQTSLGKADTAAQPSDLAGYVTKAAQADASQMTGLSLIPVGIDSNGALQAASGIVVTLSQSGQIVYADTSPNVIYMVLQAKPTIPITLIDLVGRRCELVIPPASDGGTATFVTYNASNDRMIIYTVANVGTVTSREVALGGGGGSGSAPFIVTISQISGGGYSADKTETEILAAVTNNEVVLAKTPMGTGYYSCSDDGAEFIVATGTSSSRAFTRFVIDGSTVSKSEFMAYTKPSGGIPESDLASTVQNKLPLRVTISWNGSNFVSDKTYAEVAAAETAGQPIDVSMDNMYGWFGYISSSTAVFYAVDKDANGHPLLYTFELTSSGVTTATKTLGDEIATTKTTVSGATPSIAAVDNTEYTCGTVTSLTLSSFPGTGSFVIVFTSGSTATTVALPATLKLPDTYTFEANKIYEINVVDGRALIAGWPTT